ncbi:MAG: class II aldolase/adducin family protein [Candidatus Eisenbacteria bacterium]|nr:class II aldolase/adducin family protein [Candidatus Eisenbacteria bacterium]
MMSEWQARQEIVEAGRRLSASGFAAASDGNLSARLPGGRLLVTAAGARLGDLRPEQLLVVPLRDGADGTRPRLPAHLRPTSELAMHRCAYIERPDIDAVAHAHPVMVTAFTVAGCSLEDAPLPEVILAFGSIPTAPYATPSTDAGADAIRELIRAHDVLVLDRHGALAAGRGPLDAFHKLEKLEHAARILFHARLLGRMERLPDEEAERLRSMRQRAAACAAGMEGGA